MNRQIRNIIEEYNEPFWFAKVSVTMDSIAEDEAVLNLKFPQQYIEFLQELGSGGLFGVDIFGVTKTGYRTHVTETLRYREYGLPENFLIVENCDEWVYCIDCNTGEVVSWDCSGYVLKNYDDFDSFFLNELKEAVDNA